MMEISVRALGDERDGIEKGRKNCMVSHGVATARRHDVRVASNASGKTQSSAVHGDPAQQCRG